MALATAMNERIALCRDTRRSNCAGTALYIVGMQDSDRFVTGGRRIPRHVLKPLARLEEPAEGCLVVWERQWMGMTGINHMAVVTSTEPLLVTQRPAYKGPLEEDKPISIASMFYIGQRRTYYMPNASVKVPWHLHWRFLPD